MITKLANMVYVDGQLYPYAIISEAAAKAISGIMKTAAMDEAQLDELMRRYALHDDGTLPGDNDPFDPIRLGTLPTNAVNELLSDYNMSGRMPEMSYARDGTWIVTKPAFVHHLKKHLHSLPGHTKMTKDQMRQALIEIGNAADNGELGHVLRYASTPHGMLGDKQIIGLRNDVWVDKPGDQKPAAGVDYLGNGEFVPLTVFNATQNDIDNKISRQPVKPTAKRQFVLTSSQDYKDATKAAERLRQENMKKQ